MNVERDIARQLTQGFVTPLQRPPRVRKAQVTGEFGGTLALKMGGAATALTNIPKLSDFAVQINDSVWVLELEGDLLAIGPSHDSSFPMCKVRRSTNLAVNNTTDTIVPMEVAEYDTGSGMWSSALNPSRVTMQHDGTYLIASGARWLPNASAGECYATIRLNGGTVRLAQNGGAKPAGGSYNHSFATVIDRANAATTYVELMVWHNLGAGNGTLEWALGTFGVWMSATWIGPPR